MSLSRRLLKGGRIMIGSGLQPYAGRLLKTITAVQPHLSVHVASARGEPIAKWSNELGAFDPTQDTVTDIAAKFQAFITNDDSDCDATYAVFTQRVPVLFVGPDASQLRFAPAGHPFVTSAPCETEDDVIKAVEAFLTFPLHPGRVFVVEGGDGAGKETQVKKICQRLAKEGYPVATIDYPHDAAKFGVLIREVLFAKRPGLRQVNPLVFSAVYGVNRETHQPLLAWWLLRGVNIVLDRYMTANFGHQASKFSTDEERNKAIESLRVFEEKWLDLPPADAVAYLDLPPLVAFMAMMGDVARPALDEHERMGIDYKENVRRSFLWCCQKLDGWHAIPCCEKSASDSIDTLPRRLTREEVHDQIWQLWEPLFVNRSSNSGDDTIEHR